MLFVNIGNALLNIEHIQQIADQPGATAVLTMSNGTVITVADAVAQKIVAILNQRALVVP